MQTVKWGIIGCGNVCEVKSGPGFYKADHSELIIVMRRDAEKAADFAKRHGVPQSTSNADEVIHHPDVNAVYIATPPSTHCDYALRVAEAGKPCYVEKPMAMNHRECAQMVEAFKAKNLPLYVAYYRRRLPRFHKSPPTPPRRRHRNPHICTHRPIRKTRHKPQQLAIRPIHRRRGQIPRPRITRHRHPRFPRQPHHPRQRLRTQHGRNVRSRRRNNCCI